MAAKSLSVARNTLYAWVEDYDLNKAIEEGRDTLLDMAENRLAKNISEGDTTSLIFFLKTQGKHRGYVERQENNTNLNVTGIKPIEWVTSKDVED